MSALCIAFHKAFHHVWYLVTLDVESSVGLICGWAFYKPPTVEVKLKNPYEYSWAKQWLLTVLGALEASPNGFDFVIEILNGRNYPLQPCSTERDG